MRMFRLSSWISESRGGAEAVNGPSPGLKKSAAILPPQSISVGVTEAAKRKREQVSDVKAPDDYKPPAAKRIRGETLGTTANDNKPSEKHHAVATKAVKMDKSSASESTLRDAIESQLSLEILLKHDELRLINQEMAKCQIALEQLRRCHLIPFPSAQSAVNVRQNIANGVGPALITPQRDIRAQWAAPYGVTDGPYTRHYAKWLIPDPSFDGVHPDWDRGSDKVRAGHSLLEGGRTTRHSFVESYTPASKMRTHRGSSGQKLQALPSGYTQSKENAGPSILKRADGQLVKLVCIDCRRENFGSTQGFINHCRIAHRREFKSHEEAAVQSGQPVELDEVGGVVGDEKSASTATGLVHPLIRNASTEQGAYSALLSRINDSLNLYHQGKLPGVNSIPGTPISIPRLDRRKTPGQAAPNKSFVPSSDTPFLSNLMKTRGFDGNLGEIVGEAKKVVDIDDFSSHSEESDGEKSPQRRPGNLDGPTDSPLPIMRMPARATMSPTPFGRPGSSKGPEARNARKPGAQSGISPRLAFATPINIDTSTHPHQTLSRKGNNPGEHTPNGDADHDHDILMLDGPTAVDLSPNTVASNNAPSLVSDDGEYDEGDEDAESSMDESEGEDEGSDVAEINFEDVDGLEKVVPRTALRHQAVNASLRKEDRHVTFVSPVKESTRQRRSKK